MSRQRPKSDSYYRFRIFGWHIYISRHRLKKRDSDHGYSRAYKWARRARWELTGHTCEGCGIKLPLYGHMYRILPQGHPGRNDLANLRCLCTECLKQAQRRRGFVARIAEKGGEL